jgi:hypothetical protein
MLDKLTRYLPGLSLLTVMGVAIFNIGYFWKIGLHFLGIVDLSNLVYTFGLAAAFIFIWFFVAGAVTPKKPATWKFIAIGILGSAISIVCMFSPAGLLMPASIQNFVLLLGFVILSAGALAFGTENADKTGRWNPKDVVLIIFIGIGTIFQAGLSASLLEIENPLVYTVRTKETELQNVRILRSSSSGFILSVDGRVVFIPHEEIKSISSTTPK